MLSAPALLDRAFAQVPAARSGGLAAWLHSPDCGELRRRFNGAGRAGDAAAPGARQELVARGRAVLYGLLAVCMAGSVVWQRAATRSAYDQGGRAYTVFGDGVAAGLAADCGDTPVVTDYMIWGRP